MFFAKWRIISVSGNEFFGGVHSLLAEILAWALRRIVALQDHANCLLCLLEIYLLLPGPILIVRIR